MKSRATRLPLLLFVHVILYGKDLVTDGVGRLVVNGRHQIKIDRHRNAVRLHHCPRIIQQIEPVFATGNWLNVLQPTVGTARVRTQTR